MMDTFLEGLDMVDINLSIEAEIHPGEDRAQEEERNLDVIGHAHRTRLLSIPGASGASVRLVSKSGRSLWILWQRRQRLG